MHLRDGESKRVDEKDRVFRPSVVWKNVIAKVLLRRHPCGYDPGNLGTTHDRDKTRSVPIHVQLSHRKGWKIPGENSPGFILDRHVRARNRKFSFIARTGAAIFER